MAIWLQMYVWSDSKMRSKSLTHVIFFRKEARNPFLDFAPVLQQIERGKQDNDDVEDF